MSWLKYARGTTLDSDLVYVIGTNNNIYYTSRQCGVGNQGLSQSPICPTGSSQDWGQTTCRTNCPNGYSQLSNSCQGGTFSRERVSGVSSTPPNTCPAGKSLYGVSSCVDDCPAGFHRSTVNVCQLNEGTCPPGFFSGVSGDPLGCYQYLPDGCVIGAPGPWGSVCTRTWDAPAARWAYFWRSTKGVGTVDTGNPTGASCPPNSTYNGAGLCFENCPTGSSYNELPTPVACNRDCPAGTTQYPYTCTMDPVNIARQVVDHVCPEGQVLVGGECFLPCPSTPFTPNSPLAFYDFNPILGNIQAKSILYDSPERPNGDRKIYIVGTNGLLYRTDYGFIHDFNQTDLGTPHSTWNNMTDIIWNRDGRLLIVSGNGNIYISGSSAISMAGGDVTFTIPTVQGTSQTIHAQSITWDFHNNRYVISSQDGRLYYETEQLTNQSRWYFVQYTAGSDMSAVSVSTDPFDGKLVVVGADGRVSKADSYEPTTLFTTLPNTNSVKYIFYPNPTIINCSTNYNTTPSMDYLGNDIVQITATPDICCDACTSDPLCIGYVTNTEGNSCWIKQNTGQAGLQLGSNMGIATPNNDRISHVKKQPYQQVFAMIYSGQNFNGPLRYMAELGPYEYLVDRAQSVIVGNAMLTIHIQSGQQVNIIGPTTVGNITGYIQGQLQTPANTQITSMFLGSKPANSTPSQGKYPCTWDSNGLPVEYCVNSGWPFEIENKPDIATGESYVIPNSCVPCGPSGAGAMECPTNGEWSGTTTQMGCSTCSFAPSQWNVPGGIVGTQLSCTRTGYKADPTECCLLNNATGAEVVSTIGDVTCDPQYRGPQQPGCLSSMIGACTINAIESDPVRWQTCQNYISPSNPLSSQLVRSMVASYFSKYDVTDVTPITERLLQLAAMYAGSSDDILADACSLVTHKQIMENTDNLPTANFNNQRRWCGCHLPATQYLAGEYITAGQAGQDAVVACDVACRIADGVPKGVCEVGKPCAPIQCTTSQCIMRDIEINLQDSSSGGVSLVQNCAQCTGGNCECFFGDIHLNASSSHIGAVNFSQNCNKCYELQNGVPTEVPCGSVCPTGVVCTHQTPISPAGPTSPTDPTSPTSPITPSGPTAPVTSSEGYTTLAQAYEHGKTAGAWKYLGEDKAVGRLSVRNALIIGFVLVVVLSVVLFLTVGIAGGAITLAVGIVAIIGSVLFLRNKQFTPIPPKTTS